MSIFEDVLKKLAQPFFEQLGLTANLLNNSILEPLFNQVLTPIFQSGVQALADLVNGSIPFTLSGIEQVVVNFVSNAIAAVSDVFFGRLLLDISDEINNNYQPEDPNFDRFDVVAPLSEQVESVTINDNDWSIEQQIEVRDALVASQVGFADYSDLRFQNAVDLEGYVTDVDQLYNSGGWLSEMEDWADARFDIIRVLEIEDSSPIKTFEANATLMQNTATDEYFIGIGGTEGGADALTDVNLIFEGTTGASKTAISRIIAEFFDTDIEVGAIVNLSGFSLGGAEVILQYREFPEAFGHAYAIMAPGIGGLDGTYYNQNVWDGTGDANITEIDGNDPGADFNDLVNAWGHIGAGQTYFVEEVGLAEENFDIIRDSEAFDTHAVDNLWVSLPGDPSPLVPSTNTLIDEFLFV